MDLNGNIIMNKILFAFVILLSYSCNAQLIPGIVASSNQSIDESAYTIYKQIPWSSKAAPRQNSLSDIQDYFTAGDLTSSTLFPSNDSCIIITNGRSVTDTVRKIIINHDRVAPCDSAGMGVENRGPFWMNGIDTSDDDTTTAMRYIRYVWLDSTTTNPWDYSNGSKLGGIGAYGSDSESPPSGGQKDEDCGNGEGFYESNDGFRTVLYADGPTRNYINDYVYHHAMGFDPFPGCASSFGRSNDITYTTFSANVWYKFMITVIFNDPVGTANDYFEIARNDTVVYSSNSFHFRRNSGVNIDWIGDIYFQGGDCDEGLTNDLILYSDDDTYTDVPNRTQRSIGYVHTDLPAMPTPNTTW